MGLETRLGETPAAGLLATGTAGPLAGLLGTAPGLGETVRAGLLGTAAGLGEAVAAGLLGTAPGLGEAPVPGLLTDGLGQRLQVAAQ